MDTTRSTGGRREITLPASALIDLLDGARRADEAGVRESGRATGRFLAERLANPPGGLDAARSLAPAVFWKRVTDLFAARGWGTLEHSAGPGVGELRSRDWLEADRSARDGDCTFTAGLLQGLLESVSGGQLVLEEVECRATGGAACRFLFGSAAAVEAVRAQAQPSRT